MAEEQSASDAGQPQAPHHISQGGPPQDERRPLHRVDFLELLYSDPEQIPTSLLSLHVHQDPARFCLMHQICTGLAEKDIRSDLWNRCITRSFTEALMHIAMDINIYIEPGMDGITYIFGLYTVLSQCCEYLTFKVTSTSSYDTYASLAEDFVRDSTGLWPAAWTICCKEISEKPPHIFSRQLREEMILFMYRLFKLHELSGIAEPYSLDRDMVLLLLHCWLHTSHSRCDAEATSLLYKLWYEFDDSRRDRLHWKSVVSELMHFAGTTLLEVSDRITLSMHAHRAVDDVLVGLVEWFITFVEVSPGTVEIDPRREERRSSEKLILGVSKSYRRQICSGKSELEARVLALCLKVYRMIIDRIQYGGSSFLEVVSDCKEDLKLGHFVTCILPLVLEDDRWGLRDNTFYFLELIGNFESEIRQARLPESERSTNFVEMRATFRRLYRSTMDKLLTAPLPGTSSEALRQRAITAWTTVCRKLRCISNTPAEGPEGDLSAYYGTPRKHCYNYACICNDAPPCHLMRVCKRCWRVLYCSSKCQTDDWERHRNYCIRTAASDLS